MRRVAAAVLRNRVSAIGVALVTASGLLFLFLIALDLAGFLQNPYVGIVVFVVLPAIFLLGLLLIPLGLWHARRRRPAEAPAALTLDFSDPGTRRMLVFLLVVTVLNFAIISAASFGAVEYTESQAFCGQVCHDVMGPEFVSRSGDSQPDDGL
jgi:hypothetical protein